MLERLHHFAVAIMDILLGWLLRFPSDVQLFAIAIGSAVILTAVRVWASNQDLLRRCHDDKARLKALIRDAKKRGDSGAIKRHRLTLRRVGMKQLRQEGRPLMAALVPIALVAVWAVNRLEFHPVPAAEPIEFAAYFSISASGRIAHLVPLDGITAENGWIQEITPIDHDGAPHGLTKWRLSATARPAPYLLSVRAGGKTFEHPILVGARIHEPTRKKHDGYLLATEVKMKQVRLFGVIPGIHALFLPPWLVGYLLIVIPFVFVLKRALRIY